LKAQHKLFLMKSLKLMMDGQARLIDFLHRNLISDENWKKIPVC
jgi:uncharacterized protein Usg